MKSKNTYLRMFSQRLGIFYINKEEFYNWIKTVSFPNTLFIDFDGVIVRFTKEMQKDIKKQIKKGSFLSNLRRKDFPHNYILICYYAETTREFILENEVIY